MSGKVSILILTLDRYWLTRYCIENAIAASGHEDLEILILDNGSTDQRVVDWGKSIATNHFTETENIGVSRGYNKLLKEATGDYICTISNDMLLSQDWLKQMVHYNQIVGCSGITAIHCLLDKGKVGQRPHGIYMPETGLVYSNWLWNRKLIKSIGGFNPVYIYGCDDSEYCFRAKAMGYANYYIPFAYCLHMGDDMGETSDYRKMKTAQLAQAEAILKQEVTRMREQNNYYIPL